MALVGERGPVVGALKTRVTDSEDFSFICHPFFSEDVVPKQGIF